MQKPNNLPNNTPVPAEKPYSLRDIVTPKMMAGLALAATAVAIKVGPPVAHEVTSAFSGSTAASIEPSRGAILNGIHNNVVAHHNGEVTVPAEKPTSQAAPEAGNPTP